MFESRSAKTVILASGKVLASLMSLLIAVVLTRWLSVEDYGTYRQAILIYGIAAPLAALGLHNALYYFLVVDADRARGVLVENLLLLLAGGAVLAAALAGGHSLVASWFGNPDLATVLLILAPLPLFSLVADAVGSCLLARGRAVPVVVYNVLSQVLILFFVVALCLVAASPEMAIAARVVAGAISVIVAVGMMFRACALGDWRPTARGLKEQLRFSVPLGIASVAVIVDRSVDKVWVSVLATTQEFAIYANGAMELPLIGMLTTSIAAVLTADYARLYAERQYGEILELFHRAVIKSQVFFIPIMLFLMSVTPEFIRLLYTEKYEGSAVFFRVYLLLIPIGAVSFSSVFVASGKSRHLLFQSALTLAMNTALGWYAVTWVGPIGAAVVVVGVQYLVRFPYLTYGVASILECRSYQVFPWFTLLKIAAASAVGCVLILAIKPLVAWPDVAVLGASGLLYAIVTGALFLLFGLTSVSTLLEVCRSVIQGRY